MTVDLDGLSRREALILGIGIGLETDELPEWVHDDCNNTTEYDNEYITGTYGGQHGGRYA